MRTVIATIAVAFSTTVALAGALPVPMPGAGVAGPAALVAAIGAVVGVKYLRNRRSK
jgi:hypothetical protein